ncbi:MAG: hypothetical protein FJX23_06460, partial [Alphaproteobacteria bacterium]|nr:hypothetical protein [Alphaproteobacteria bacterium]
MPSSPLKKRLFPALLCAATMTFAATEAFAVRQLSGSDKENAREAFYFVERDNWREALLHARRAKNPLVSEYMTWRVLRNSPSEFGFSAYNKFLKDNPDWPDHNRLVIRAENALFTEGAGSFGKGELQDWFKRNPPISGKGKIAYAQLLGQTPEATKLIREAWVGGDFEAAQEQYILNYYGSILREQDHRDRIDRLLWEGKTSAAQRIFSLVPEKFRTLYDARIALGTSASDANSKVSRVSSDLQNDSGLLYERLKWRERKGGMDDGVREILLSPHSEAAFPEKWWSARHKQVRNALDNGQYKLALNLLENHGQTNPANLADALFLQGWINLTKLKQPAKALPYFEKLDSTVTFPVSKSRAAYWIGRTYAALGQQPAAQKWFTIGAEYTTTFYGQLS